MSETPTLFDGTEWQSLFSPVAEEKPIPNKEEDRTPPPMAGTKCTKPDCDGALKYVWWRFSNAVGLPYFRFRCQVCKKYAVFLADGTPFSPKKEHQRAWRQKNRPSYSKCPKCSSAEVRKKGVWVLKNEDRRERMSCKACGHIWNVQWRMVVDVGPVEEPQTFVNVPIKCVQCDRKFRRTMPNQKYCSTKCQNTAEKRRQRVRKKVSG